MAVTLFAVNNKGYFDDVEVRGAPWTARIPPCIPVHQKANYADLMNKMEAPRNWTPSGEKLPPPPSSKLSNARLRPEG